METGIILPSGLILTIYFVELNHGDHVSIAVSNPSKERNGKLKLLDFGSGSIVFEYVPKPTDWD